MSKIFLFLGTLIITLFGLTTTLLVAPVSSDGGLPPRPPTTTPIAPAGGLIILGIQTTSPVSSSLWTIVQWQDALGDWHDVEGWQGNFNERLEVVWWVAPEDLDKGPFRWVIYEQQNSDDIVAFSESFDLPAYNKAIVKLEIVLP